MIPQTLTKAGSMKNQPLCVGSVLFKIGLDGLLYPWLLAMAVKWTLNTQRPKRWEQVTEMPLAFKARLWASQEHPTGCQAI